MVKRKTRPSFDPFSGYNWYVPGISGMFMLLLMFITGAVLGNVITFGMMMISPELAGTYGMMISYPVMFIPAMLYAASKSRRNEMFETGYALDSRNFGPFSNFSIALAVSIVTLALIFVLDIFTVILPPMPEYLEEVFKNMMDGPLWITLILVSVFAPFFEEWLCRGMILRGLLQKMHPAAAICISALFFAVIHMNPWQAIPAFAIGIVLGYVYYRTGSLKLTMLMHCVNNTVAAVSGHLDRFKDADTFMDIMSTPTYVCMYILCIAMIALFFVRMRAIPIPFGQRSGSDVLNADTRTE